VFVTPGAENTALKPISDAMQIRQFAALFANNARQLQELNRRFLLAG
jgi:carbonic anhydrase